MSCMDVMSCVKLKWSDRSDVEKSLLNGKRDCEFRSVSSQKQERSQSERQNLHDYLGREPLRAQVRENYLRLKWRRDRMIWDKRNSDWAVMHGINSHLQSQQSELHPANSVGLSSSNGKPQDVRIMRTKSRLYQESHAKDCMYI